jgi:hypothetical protein
VNVDERTRWARVLAITGWLFLISYLGLVAGLIRQAAATTDASFEDGLWWQRVETVSFASRTPNLVVLVPAVAAAVVGSVIARPLVDASVLQLRRLVRVVAGTCYVVLLIAAVGTIGIFFRNPDSVGDVSVFFGLIGGILMAIAMIKLCLEAERSG